MSEPGILDSASSAEIGHLPIIAHAGAIAAAAEQGPLILRAEPGAGKSSVVPLILAQRYPPGQILITQPRRVATLAVAQRLAELLGQPLGRDVGYAMRDDRKGGANCRLMVVTEALVLQRLLRDAELEGVAAIIFDEFHERSTSIDLALAMATEIRGTIRPDLGLTVMSATLALHTVADRLEGARIIDVPGRSFPVTTIHRARPNRTVWAEQLAATTIDALAYGHGDLIVFVPGRADIRRVQHHLDQHLAAGGHDHRGVELIELHGSTPVSTQRALLQPGDRRRIIVATSIAETSITIPSVDVVVDGGLARRPRFHRRTGLGRLETGFVTRFAAEQRRGRVGRVRSGVCVQLWSEAEARHLDDAELPAIVAGDPLPPAMALASWGDPYARALPLIDHPGQDQLRSAHTILELLGLLEPGTLRVTTEGHISSQLGVHPRVGALLCTAWKSGRVDLGLLVAATLDEDRFDPTVHFGQIIEHRRSALGRSINRLRRRMEVLSAQHGLATDSAAHKTDGSPTPQNRSMSSPDATTHDVTARLAVNDDAIASLLAQAWPDRVAFYQPQSGRYQLFTGPQLESPSLGPRSQTPAPWEGHDTVVIVNADGDRDLGRIRHAIGLERDTALTLLARHIRSEDRIEWAGSDPIPRTLRTRRVGEVVLHHETVRNPDPDTLRDAIAERITAEGVHWLPWSEQDHAMLARLRWLHGQDPSWPDLSWAELARRSDEWLDLSGVHRPTDLVQLRLGALIRSLLPYDRVHRLDTLAPATFAPPRGRAVPIDYSGETPKAAIRLQHVLGLTEHPCIGPASQPLLLDLLSPAGRTAQLTADLPGFWAESYRLVRADLRGRYPKHDWPEDPTAQP